MANSVVGSTEMAMDDYFLLGRRMSTFRSERGPDNVERKFL
jgi:hypothetical protein